MAASSLTASFLGAQTIQHESGLSVLSGLALISLAVSVPSSPDANPHLGVPQTCRSQQAALEQITRPIVTALPHRYALKSRERLNRLLVLLQLHINGDDDVYIYAKRIRAWLTANGGHPAGQRRAIADPAGSPSLRRLTREGAYS